jgi:hypothetical protein
MEAIEEGGAQETRAMAGGGTLCCEAGGLEVGERADMWGRSGDEREEGKGKWSGGGVGGLEEKVGRAGKNKGSGV